MGAWPGAVEASPRLWGQCHGLWGRDQDRGGAVRGRGVKSRPWGCSQCQWGRGKGRRSTEWCRGGVAKTVGVRYVPWGAAMDVWVQPGA